VKILLTRHGETLENKKWILQGWRPGHLSKKGKEQAKLLADRLKDVKIDVIYTSDLKRCIDTAKVIAKYHKNAKFIEEKLIRERKLGEFEGKVIDDSEWEKLWGNFYTFKPKKGEYLNEVWKRISKFYKHLLKKYNGKTILIVGHDSAQALLQRAITKSSPEDSLNEQCLENTAISEFEVDKKGDFKIIRINCKEHLK
jgi:probable phosphoglycerate mutase